MRLAHGLSQSDVADLWNARYPADRTPMSFKTISSWETWPQSGHQPTLVTLAKLAQLYECEVRDLVDTGASWQPARLPTTVPPAVEPDDAVASKPRSLGLPDTASESRVPSADVDAAIALASDPRANATTVRTLRACIADYWRRDDEYGGEAIRPAILGHLRYVLHLLKSPHPESLTRDLHAVAAELARLVGWTYFDAQQFAAARNYFTEAMRLARTINDELFMANVLSCLSLQATYEAKPADAAALAQTAQDLLRGHNVPRVLAILKTREAFALAALSDRSGCHHALNAARDALDRAASAPEPAWASYFDETKLTVDTGIARARLGDHADAERLISAGIQSEAEHQQRPRAFHYFWLATTQLGCGNLDQACHTAARALVLNTSLDSARTRSHLKDFRVQLEPHQGEPLVQDFEARLRRALPC